MATYQELSDMSSENDLIARVAVAATVKAEDLITAATPTSAEITWANNTIVSPISRAKSLLRFVLATNKALSAASIRAATDASLQTNVDTAVNALIAGGVE